MKKKVNSKQNKAKRKPVVVAKEKQPSEMEFVILDCKPTVQLHRILHTGSSNRLVKFSMSDLVKIREALQLSGAQEIGVNITD